MQPGDRRADPGADALGVGIGLVIDLSARPLGQQDGGVVGRTGPEPAVVGDLGHRDREARGAQMTQHPELVGQRGTLAPLANALEVIAPPGPGRDEMEGVAMGGRLDGRIFAEHASPRGEREPC